MIDDYARASAAAGGFDHGDAALIRLSMKLDAKGWQQLAKACKRLYEQAQRIEADARERLDGAAPHEEEEIDVGLVMMMFEAIALGEAIDGADGRHRRGARRRDGRRVLARVRRRTGVRRGRPDRLASSTTCPTSPLARPLAAPAAPPRQPHRHPLLARARR